MKNQSVEMLLNRQIKDDRIYMTTHHSNRTISINMLPKC